jgi:hypothetical protein
MNSINFGDILIRPLDSNYKKEWISSYGIRKNYTDIIGRKGTAYNRYEYWYKPTFLFWNEWFPNEKYGQFEFGVELKRGRNMGLIMMLSYDQAYKLSGYHINKEQQSKWINKDDYKDITFVNPPINWNHGWAGVRKEMKEDDENDGNVIEGYDENFSNYRNMVLTSVNKKIKK